MRPLPSPKSVDLRIHELSDERDIGNGIFVYLEPGWAMYPGTGEAHCFSEDTMRDVRRMMKGGITHCECDECRTEVLPGSPEAETFSLDNTAAPGNGGGLRVAPLKKLAMRSKAN